MLAPVGAESASQDPQQLVPEAQPSMRSASSRPGEHGELMVQEQVLEDQILAWAHNGLHGCEEEPENVMHGVSIADLPPRQVLPPHSAWTRKTRSETAGIRRRSSEAVRGQDD